MAAYAFDARSDTTAADSSGESNAGAVSAATWARGRHGQALRFDGAAAVVRVPPSPSLDLTRAMTVSAWIRPTTRQSGWRTIVQREADAYMLTASSDRQNRVGVLDDLRAALVVAAAMWFCFVIATARAPSTGGRRRTWWAAVALFGLGSLADAALAPAGTLAGPILVALWLTATAPSSVEVRAFLLFAAVAAALTLASLAGIGGADLLLSRYDGAVARSAALGALFVLAGLVGLRRRPAAPVPATPP